MNNNLENKPKILVIFSQLHNCAAKKFIDFTVKTSTIFFDEFDMDYIIDPTRYELENLVIKNSYICIIPCSQYIYNKVLDTNKNNIKKGQNIIKILQTLGVDYFGNDYVTHLILNDRISYLKTSCIGIPTKIITSYSYFNIPNYTDFIKEWLPVTFEIIFNDNCVDLNKYIINSMEQANNILKMIFTNNQNAEEILVTRYFPEANHIFITIFGNNLLAENLIYMYNNSTVNARIKESLFVESKKLFKDFSLKDFSQFEYVVIPDSEAYYLKEINCTDCLNEYTINGLIKQYNVDFKTVMCILILVHLFNTNQDDLYDEFIFKLSKYVPDVLIDILFPLSFKRQNKKDYSYKDICAYLKLNFLYPDESNITDISKLFEISLKNLPKPQYYESPFLGERQYQYDFLDMYNNIPIHPNNIQNVLQDSLQILNGQTRWHSPTMLNNVDPPAMFNAVVSSAITNIYNPSAMERSSSAGYIKMEQKIIEQMSVLIGWDKEDSGGTFTTGGKNCIMYAVKCGLNRCLKNTSSDKQPIVITSDINHYSIDSVCNQLGLGKKSCIRIPSDHSGTIDLNIFRKVLHEKASENIPIACVVFSGGNTTHCTVENIQKGALIVNEVAKQTKLNYVPYIYYDFVVCWPWLFYKQYDFDTNILNIKENILKKIYKVKNIIQYAYLSDGVGIDFHKLGFAPLPNSLFLTKEALELYSLLDGNIDAQFREPYHYTFCNSRTCTHIISAWNILHCVGYEGFQAYIANMLTVTNVFESILPQYGCEILNKKITYGFATILWTTNDSAIQHYSDMFYLESSKIKANNQYLYDFSEYLKDDHHPGYFLRFLPNYAKTDNGQSIAALSILPMTFNINENNANIFANHIGALKGEFDQKYALGYININKKIPPVVPK